MNRIEFEICVDTYAGAEIAAQNGATRIELCSSLSEGGLTPSAGLMKAAAALPVPVYAMIRPRGGDFVYSDTEKQIIREDVKVAEQFGLAGIVTGAATPKSKLDTTFLRTVLQATKLKATLHRVIDTLEDPFDALDEAVDLGFERILTSGQAETALDGLATITAMAERAGNRISVMAGTGVTRVDALQILSASGIKEVHSSCSKRGPAPSPGSKAAQLGFVHPQGEKTTDPALVTEFAALLAAHREAM